MSRRGHSRRFGVHAPSSGSIWTPQGDQTILEYVDDEDLSNGSVSSWLGKIRSSNFAQGTGANQPTMGASGLAFTTNDSLRLPSGTSLTQAIDALSAVSVILAVSSTLATTVASYLVLSGLGVAGSFGVAINDPTTAGGTVENWCRGGASGGGAAGYADENVDLTSLKIVSVGCNIATPTTGCPFIRVNGVEQTVVSNPGATAPGTGTFSDLAIDVGGITGLFHSGLIRAVMFVDAGSVTSTIRNAERYLAAKKGVTL